MSRFVWLIDNASQIHHTLCSDDSIRVRVFVFAVNHAFDAALDDGFGAFVAGKERHIKGSVPEGLCAGIENCVELRVADVKVFCVKRIAFTFPRHDVVTAAGWHAVVADR